MSGSRRRALRPGDAILGEGGRMVERDAVVPGIYLGKITRILRKRRSFGRKYLAYVAAYPDGFHGDSPGCWLVRRYRHRSSIVAEGDRE